MKRVGKVSQSGVWTLTFLHDGVKVGHLYQTGQKPMQYQVFTADCERTAYVKTLDEAEQWLSSTVDKPLIDVVKMPVSEVWRFVKEVAKKKCEECEKRFIESALYSYLYAKDILRGRFYEGEAVIATHPTFAARYAADVIKGRWPEAEATIALDAEQAFNYAQDVVKGRFELGEPAISTNPNIAYRYALDFVKGRWEMCEPVLKTDNLLFKSYEKFWKGIEQKKVAEAQKALMQAEQAKAAPKVSAQMFPQEMDAKELEREIYRLNALLNEKRGVIVRPLSASAGRVLEI